MMVLVDTSVWVEHLRGSTGALAPVLESGEVLMHPFVTGELACGQLRNRRTVLELLGSLPAVPTATDTEAIHFIEEHRLMGAGLGYIDVHLLAATALGNGARLWTRDTRLSAAAHRLGLSYFS